MSKTARDSATELRKASKRKPEDEREPGSPPKKSKKLHGSSSQRRKVETPSKPASTAVPAKDRSVNIDSGIAERDPSLLADLFAQKIAKHYKDSSLIEREDMSVPKSWIIDTTEFDQPHTAGHLPGYLEKFAGGGRDKLLTGAKEASPDTLIVACSGIRVADLVRELRVYDTKDSKVAKLIAKHMKLKENIEYLAKTKVGIAVGTPARLYDLVEQGGLKIDELKTVVVDGSYLDEKRRGIWDMGDVFGALMRLLHHERVKGRLESEDGAKVVVF
ncbi:Protein cms1 [Cyphellophora attinorum]|uniref:Protein cms1 n=1 Tax=Cyphellophora attinorum TaxID=1664694 RepID=A0A0N1NZ89_9EURO|nr:Protein cms1 [Phialophora attinorum]KPI40530.1 Protein cms1 [Phialophora attinorum]